MAVLAIATLTSCAPWTLTGRPIAGHVVDAETGQPLANAQVIYQWQGSSIRGNWDLRAIGGHGNPTICYHTMAATTDVNGAFRIPAWEKRQTYELTDQEPVGWAYAQGYVPTYFMAWRGVIKSGTLFDHPDDVFRLSASHATGKARLEEIWSFVRRGCSYGGDSQRALVPVLTAAYNEAKALAVTAEELKQAHHFARMIAWAAVAPDMQGSATGSDAKIDEYLREHFPEAASR